MVNRAHRAAKRPEQKKSGWKKQQQQPKAATREDKGGAAANIDDQLPLSLQQRLLDIFSDACMSGALADFEATLQEVKGHLYNRDFATAFGKDEYLQAYAARWSPSRALGYAQVFHELEGFMCSGIHGIKRHGAIESENDVKPMDIERELPATGKTDDATALAERIDRILAISTKSTEPTLGEDTEKPSGDSQETNKGPANPNSLRMACIGGGAGAEIVGLAGWLKSMESEGPDSSGASTSTPPDLLEVSCLDIARWDTVVNDLYQCCVSQRKLSKYASAAAIAANVALLPPQKLKVSFQQKDVLDLDPSEAGTLFSGMDVVTIMFTLNELYTASVPKAQRLLHNLTATMRSGALLLVLDSPGSYSAVTINGAERKYPMQWLLDHTLLDDVPSKKGGSVPARRWDKLVSHESKWFRLQEGMKYPIDLENMRYQIHLYRRCASG